MPNIAGIPRVLRTVRLFRMVGVIPRNRPHCVTVRNAFQVAARCPDSPSSVNLVKKAVVGILNRVPVVLIVIGEALVICAVIVTFSGDAAPADGQ